MKKIAHFYLALILLSLVGCKMESADVVDNLKPQSAYRLYNGNYINSLVDDGEYLIYDMYVYRDIPQVVFTTGANNIGSSMAKYINFVDRSGVNAEGKFVYDFELDVEIDIDASGNPIYEHYKVYAHNDRDLIDDDGSEGPLDPYYSERTLTVSDSAGAEKFKVDTEVRDVTLYTE